MIMKRYILAILSVFLACSYTNAQISFYGEWYRKGSGKLDSKMWHTPTASRSEYYGDAEGAGTVMIFKFDEMKAYIIDDAKKTIMIIDDVNKLSTNRVVGMDIEVSHSSSKEFKGIEDIEGKECEHYLIKSEATYKGGGKEKASYNEWIWPALKTKFYNGSIQHDNTHYSMDYTLVMRNIQIGGQPSHLFDIPQGYKTMVLPAGGLMEMITGKPKTENDKMVDEKKNEATQMMNAFKEKLDNSKSSGKSQEEQLKGLMELLGTQKKN